MGNTVTLSEDKLLNNQKSQELSETYESLSSLHESILKHIYNLQYPYISFNKLYKLLKNKLSTRTLRRKIYDLRDKGFISTSNEGVLCISPVKEHKEEVKDILKKHFINVKED